MRDPHLEAEAPENRTAADIVGRIDTLLALRDAGAEVDEKVKAAIELLMNASCQSYEDALAFISFSHRILTGPDECSQPADNASLLWGARFLERAYDFLYADGRASGKVTAPHYAALH